MNNSIAKKEQRMSKKRQIKKGLLESIFEKSVQGPLALEQQSFHPPDINQVCKYTELCIKYI